MGSLPYLKHKYGSGYKLMIIKNNSNFDEYNDLILNEFKNCFRIEDNS